eukprot:12802926-Ditylum_brightwellii.AAC.1
MVPDYCQKLYEHRNPVSVATEVSHVIGNALINEIHNTHPLVVMVDKQKDENIFQQSGLFICTTLTHYPSTAPLGFHAHPQDI